MTTERDPRIDPKAGDVLTAQEKKSKKAIVRVVQRVDNGVVYFSAARPINLSCFIPKWIKWAAKSTVVKAAPCLILATLLMTGCRNQSVEIQQTVPTGLKLVTIDGCQYIWTESYQAPVVHKANCTNHPSKLVLVGRNGDSKEDVNPGNLGVGSGTVITTIPPKYISDHPAKPNVTPPLLRKDLTNLFVKFWTIGNNHAEAVASGNALAAEVSSKEFFIKTLDEMFTEEDRK